MGKESERIKEDRLDFWRQVISFHQWTKDYDIEKINRTQFRITRNTGERIDIYPKGQKFFNITTQKWGRIEDIEDFVETL